MISIYEPMLQNENKENRKILGFMNINFSRHEQCSRQE